MATRRRRHIHKPSAYAVVAHQYLEHAEAIWTAADGLDTAVRDSVAEGLARIVRAAYDCQALDAGLQGIPFLTFIDQSTADWFRRREFSEWFCIAAASGFNTSRPRELADWRFEKPVHKKWTPRSKAKLSSTAKHPRRKDPAEAKTKGRKP